MARKARIAVIGAGWWAAVNHIPLLLKNPDCELVGASRLGAAELAKLREAFPAIPVLTEDYRALLAETRPDGVVIASPHVDHHEHAKAALDAGCHVLVEKPLTTSAADARDLVERAPMRPAGRSSWPMAGTSSLTSATPASSSRAAHRPDRARRPADGLAARGPLGRPADGRDRRRHVPPAALDLGRPEARRRLRLGPARPRARPPLPRRRPRAGRGLRPHRHLARRRRLLRRRRGPLREWRHRQRSRAPRPCRSTAASRSTSGSSAPRACCSSTSSASAWSSAAATADDTIVPMAAGDGAYTCEEPLGAPGRPLPRPRGR